MKTNTEKPYKVIASHVIRCRVVSEQEWDYAHYWQANLRSWWMHWIGGFDCNTYKLKEQDDI